MLNSASTSFQAPTGNKSLEAEQLPSSAKDMTDLKLQSPEKDTALQDVEVTAGVKVDMKEVFKWLLRDQVLSAHHSHFQFC